MDSKNVILAVVFSTIVLVFWGTFFAPPEMEREIQNNTTNQIEEGSSPSIEDEGIKNELTRNNAITSVDRIEIENENIKGSISLQGAIIDDVIFKNYKKSLDSEEKVIFLNPKDSTKEYYVETGWASSGTERINLPLDNTIWKVKGNNKLTPSSPVTLEWDNGEGLIFTKKIKLDDKFLFEITQSVKNNSNKSFQFYPFAQIT